MFAGLVSVSLREKLLEKLVSMEKSFAVTFFKYCKNPVDHALVCYICVISEWIHFSLTGTLTANKNRTSELSRTL